MRRAGRRGQRATRPRLHGGQSDNTLPLTHAFSVIRYALCDAHGTLSEVHANGDMEGQGMITEEPTAFIVDLRANPRLASFDEAATKQGVVLPILHMLGWNTYNIEEVTPEYSIESRRVDYALRLNRNVEFFIEAKNAGESLESHQEQLLEYSFRAGAELAALTNGITWWFYLPTKRGDWKTRKFYTIDIVQQEPDHAAQKFVELLSKENVQSKKAVQFAESIYRGQVKKRTIEAALPDAWNRIIGEPHSSLVQLLAETTEKACGFKPEPDKVKDFLRAHDAGFLVAPDFPEEKPAPVRKASVSRQEPSRKHMTQHDLIPHMLAIIHRRGGKARKEEVEREILAQFRDVFGQPYYQERVSNEVPRWQHNLAWAKEAAKKRGLVKRPEESGRGYWELTASGVKLAESQR